MPKTKLKIEKTKENMEIIVYDGSTKSIKTEIVPYVKSDKKELKKKKVLAQYVYVYQVNQRQGTRQTKTRGEVNASTRKIYRQKGTGRARHGSKKAPIFMGGGIAHGPRNKVYKLRINKKQKQLSMRYALEQKLSEKRIAKLSNVNAEKTKTANEIMKKLGWKNALLVIGDTELAKMRGFKNLPEVKIVKVSELNTYHVLLKQNLISSIEAWEKLKTFISHI